MLLIPPTPPGAEAKPACGWDQAFAQALWSLNDSKAPRDAAVAFLTPLCSGEGLRMAGPSFRHLQTPPTFSKLSTQV